MSNYSIFSVLGIEIEYMIVDKDSLRVKPIADRILQHFAGAPVNSVALGDIAMSNELVMHVLELKNNGPKPPHAPLAKQFQKTLLELHDVLSSFQAILLPGGAHPTMDPFTETVRWPHGNKAIYQQYDAIFGCKGHGWANLQAMHVNLPYANNEEFNQLHNGIRLLLPLLPALAASTPILDGKPTGMLDSRLYFYEKNQQKIPCISGDIIPDFLCSESEYQDTILQPMYQAISPFDPQGILQEEWLNSRGAIPKFEYKAIEIRIIDTQECIDADIAIAKATHAILQFWQTNSAYYLDKPYPTAKLKSLYDKAIVAGLSVMVEDMELMAQWQLPKRSMSLRNVWSALIERVSQTLEPNLQQALERILSEGNLSERILRAHKKHALTDVYHQLANCLLYNTQFTM